MKRLTPGSKLTRVCKRRITGLLNGRMNQDNSANHIQPNAAAQPIIVTKAVNGMPAFYFDGVADTMTFSLPVNSLTILAIILAGTLPASSSEAAPPSVSAGNDIAVQYPQTALLNGSYG